jgi:hypothetical protein
VAPFQVCVHGFTQYNADSPLRETSLRYPQRDDFLAVEKRPYKDAASFTDTIADGLTYMR